MIQQQGTMVYLYLGRDVYTYDVRQQPIGSGAMGTVYRGRCMRDNRPVAIKMVNPQYAMVPSVRRRAREEAHLAFRHQHLIEMLGLVESPDPRGPMFIISNFVYGTTLDKHVRHNLSQFPDRVARTCRTILPVLDALDYLHQSGIYHLDIKPSNIMVEDGRNIRLMDLGIAFTRDAAEITRAGLLGTPGYAAPEQEVLPGKKLEVDARTDLYELGITLYELLAGTKPEQGRPADIPGVNRHIMDVIRKATNQDKEQRFSSAVAMSEALKAAIAAPPEKPWYQRWPIILGIAFAAFVLFMLAAMVVVMALR